MFRINGLKVDADAIGKGVYAMICERGDESVVAFGMIPKWAIDLMRPALRDKIVAEGAKRIGCTVAEVQPFLDEDLIAKTVSEIEHEVVLGIYAAASKAGRMVA